MSASTSALIDWYQPLHRDLGASVFCIDPVLSNYVFDF